MYAKCMLWHKFYNCYKYSKIITEFKYGKLLITQETKLSKRLKNLLNPNDEHMFFIANLNRENKYSVYLIICKWILEILDK